MPKYTKYPEVHTKNNLLENKNVKVIHLDNEYVSVKFAHPNLGEVTEVFKKMNNKAQDLALKCIYPGDLQDEDDVYIAKDYYNLHLLDGWETYLEYYNPEDGWYLLSRNFEGDEFDARYLYE